MSKHSCSQFHFAVTGQNSSNCTGMGVPEKGPNIGSKTTHLRCHPSVLDSLPQWLPNAQINGYNWRLFASLGETNFSGLSNTIYQ